MPNTVSFQSSDAANLLFPRIHTFPNIVLFQGHVSHLMWEPGSSGAPRMRMEQLHSMDMPCFPWRKKKKHFGIQRLLPNTATPSALNIPAWERKFLLLNILSVTQARALRSSSEIITLLLKKGTWGWGTLRPRQPLAAQGQHLAAITRPMECKAAIFGTGGTGREQTGHYLHIKGSYLPRHHHKGAWQTSTLGNLWGGQEMHSVSQKVRGHQTLGPILWQFSNLSKHRNTDWGFSSHFQPALLQHTHIHTHVHTHTHSMSTLGLLQKLFINHSFLGKVWVLSDLLRWYMRKMPQTITQHVFSDEHFNPFPLREDRKS